MRLSKLLTSVGHGFLVGKMRVIIALTLTGLCELSEGSPPALEHSKCSGNTKF